MLKNSIVRYKRFGIVSYDVVTDPSLSLNSKALYSILCVYANKQRYCWPSLATLADTSDVSLSTIKRSIKELKNKNYIKREGRRFKLL